MGELRPRLIPVSDIFSDLLDSSHAARYGLDRVLHTRFARSDAQAAVAGLERLVSIIESDVR